MFFPLKFQIEAEKNQQATRLQKSQFTLSTLFD